MVGYPQQGHIAVSKPLTQGIIVARGCYGQSLSLVHATSLECNGPVPPLHDLRSAKEDFFFSILSQSAPCQYGGVDNEATLGSSILCGEDFRITVEREKGLELKTGCEAAFLSESEATRYPRSLRVRQFIRNRLPQLK
jgi:hypothetical protein